MKTSVRHKGKPLFNGWDLNQTHNTYVSRMHRFMLFA